MTAQPQPQSFTAGGSAWAGDLASYYQALMQNQFQQDELKFRRWAAEKGFEVDEKNRAWLKEQFYQSQEYNRQEALGYMQTTPFSQERASGTVVKDEKAAALKVWEQKGNVRKLYNGKEEKATEADKLAAVAQYLKNEGSGKTAMQYGEEKGWFTSAANAAKAGASGNGMAPTLERQQIEWANQISQQGLGLNYMQLLASQKGPRDWLTYANTVRNAQGSQLPAWAQALTQGQSLPAFQGADALPEGYYYNNQQQQSPQNQAVMMQQQGYQQQSAAYPQTYPVQPQVQPNGMPMNYPAEYAPQGQYAPQAQAQPVPAQQATNGYYGQPQQYQTGSMPSQQVDPSGYLGQLKQQTQVSMPIAQAQAQAQSQPQAPAWMNQLVQTPQGIRANQWNNMLPFEQQMLAGAIEQNGADFETWQQQMQRSWNPRQRVTPISTWQQ